MNQIYCPECGFKNATSFSIPKFCGGCGKSLTVSVSSISKTKEKDENDEFADEPTTPDIKKLNVQITVEKPQRETVGQVWGTGALGGGRPLNHEKIDRKKFLEDFRKRNGSTTVLTVGDKSSE